MKESDTDWRQWDRSRASVFQTIGPRLESHHEHAVSTFGILHITAREFVKLSRT